MRKAGFSVREEGVGGLVDVVPIMEREDADDGEFLKIL